MKSEYLSHGLPSEWGEVASIFTALGDSYRQRILLAFEPDERLSIQQIADHLALSRTSVVHHLKVLRDAGILYGEKSGRETQYRLDPSRVQWALDALQIYVNALHGDTDRAQLA